MCNHRQLTPLILCKGHALLQEKKKNLPSHFAGKECSHRQNRASQSYTSTAREKNKEHLWSAALQHLQLHEPQCWSLLLQLPQKMRDQKAMHIIWEKESPKMLMTLREQLIRLVLVSRFLLQRPMGWTKGSTTLREFQIPKRGYFECYVIDIWPYPGGPLSKI